jgi:glycosyltransferase involved in cell wall biosynthesis
VVVYWGEQVSGNNDLVSVIITTYNRAEYLKRALASVINQTHKDLEIIIVDDNSDDDTSELVSDFSKMDKRILSLRNDKNQGYGFGRKLGMEISKGAFISFLDDDDEWLENKIKYQLIKAKELNTPTLILCNGFDSVRIEEFAMAQSVPDGFIHFKKNKTPLGYALPSPSHWFFSKAVFETVGSYDASFRSWADSDYLLRIFLNEIPIYYFNELLVRRYRLENKEHVSQVGETWNYSKEKFLKKHYQHINKDRNFLFRFYYSIGKDYLKINNKIKARNYFLKALKLKPYKIDIAFKIIFTTLKLLGENFTWGAKR